MNKLLIFLGVVLIIIGIAWPFLKKMGLGHLPGDIMIKRDGFILYFPILTCLILSVVLSFIFWFFNR